MQNCVYIPIITKATTKHANKRDRELSVLVLGSSVVLAKKKKGFHCAHEAVAEEKTLAKTLLLKC